MVRHDMPGGAFVPPPPPDPSGAPPDADACVNVDSSLLGLGVRIGVYLQLIATGILIILGGHGTLPGHGMAASITLAATVAVLILRVAEGDILAAEFVCVITLANVQAFIAMIGVIAGYPFDMRAARGSLKLRFSWHRHPYDAMRDAGRRALGDAFDEGNRWHRLEAMKLDVDARSRRRLERGITLQVAVLVIMFGLTTWFWQDGFRGLLQSGCKQAVSAFFFFPVAAFGWQRYLFLIHAYSSVIIISILLLVRVVVGCCYPEDPPQASLTASTPLQLTETITVQRLSGAHEFQKWSAVAMARMSAARIGAWCLLAGVSFSVIEMNVHYNGFHSIITTRRLESTGQILSVIIGVALVVNGLLAPVAPCRLWEVFVKKIPQLLNVMPDYPNPLWQEFLQMLITWQGPPGVPNVTHAWFAGLFRRTKAMADAEILARLP